MNLIILSILEILFPKICSFEKVALSIRVIQKHYNEKHNKRAYSIPLIHQ